MLGRVREAVADAAETLRRLFSDPVVHAVPRAAFRVVPRHSAPLAAQAQAGWQPPEVLLRILPRMGEGLRVHIPPPFEARLQSEEGWSRWGAEATVVAMVPLRPGGAARAEVPPLPRRGASRSALDPIRAPAARRVWEAFREGRARRLDPALEVGGTRSGLQAMFERPISVQGEDLQRLPKGLWMRYSLQMVRATGENVRNLEVLGLFRLPKRGVGELRHDPRRGRILVRLGAEAAGAPRVPFILARRRSDGALLSCYLEEP